MSIQEINTENNVSSSHFPLCVYDLTKCAAVCVYVEEKEERVKLCVHVADTPVREVAETWCSCNLMRPMVCGECECVSCHRRLLWARKWGLQPFTVWTNRPIKMKTWLPMRCSRSSRLQNRAVGTRQMEHEIFYVWITNGESLHGERACGWNGLLKMACGHFKNARKRKPQVWCKSMH